MQTQCASALMQLVNVYDSTPVYVRYSDITELTTKPHRHVGSIPNVNKDRVKMRKSDISDANIIFRPCISS